MTGVCLARCQPAGWDEKIWRTAENGKKYQIDEETGEITRGNIGQKEWDSPSGQESRRDKVEDAMREIANGKAEATVAGLRNDLEQHGGTNDVTIIRGDDKKGLIHIESRHGSASIAPVLEAVANGKIVRFSRGNKTVAIQKDGYEAILSLEEHGKKKTWLLTGYRILEDNKKAPTGDSGKFCTRHASTHAGPTSSRPDMGAVSSFSQRIGQVLKKSNLCPGNALIDEEKLAAKVTADLMAWLRREREALTCADAAPKYRQPLQPGPFTGPFAGLNRIRIG